MRTPLQVISDFGCPTSSYIAAIQFFSSREDLEQEQYDQGIKDIVGMDEVPTMSYVMSRTLFLYLIQETIRTYSNGMIPNMDGLFVECVNKANAYITNNPWAVMRFTTPLSEQEESSDGTAPRQMVKGGKKEITERLFKELKAKGSSRQEIIQAFEDATGMTKAGATTYFHTLKKELGFVEKQSNGSAPKKESKQEIAERLYQQATDKSKEVLISLFTEKLGTSKLGAQTYYYACKKKFEPLTQ